MLRLILLALLIFLFTQTAFFKHDVVPQYKNFEAKVTKLLAVKPEDIKKAATPATDTSYQQPVAPQGELSDSSDDSISSFMPKSSSSGASSSSASPNPGVRTLTIKY